MSTRTAFLRLPPGATSSCTRRLTLPLMAQMPLITTCSLHRSRSMKWTFSSADSAVLMFTLYASHSESACCCAMLCSRRTVWYPCAYSQGHMSKEGPESAAETAKPVFQRKARGNIRKRPAEDSDEAAAAPVIKAAKFSAAAAPAVNFSTKRGEDSKLAPFVFESDRTLQQQTDQGLTKTLETETAFDRDAR